VNKIIENPLINNNERPFQCQIGSRKQDDTLHLIWYINK